MRFREYLARHKIARWEEGYVDYSDVIEFLESGRQFMDSTKRAGLPEHSDSDSDTESVSQLPSL